MTREELKNITVEEIYNSGEFEYREYGLTLFLEVEGKEFMPIVYISDEDIRNYFYVPYADNEDVEELYWANEDEINLHFIRAQIYRIKAEIQRKLKERK